MMRTLVATSVAVAIAAALWQGQPGATAERHACMAPEVFGDLDGNHVVEAADALWILRDIAHLPLPEGSGCSPADIDCDGDESAVDALKLLRHVAALPYGQTPPCPAIGSSMQ